MDISSKYLQNAVEEIASLPGIGRKTALRLALHILRRQKEEVLHFSTSIAEMKEHIQFCKKCGNISDEELCGICASTRRDKSIVCISSCSEAIGLENIICPSASSVSV